MTTATSSPPADAAERDGQHHFDFVHGSWDVELQRLQDPLTGSTTWIEYVGRSVCRPLWDGRANIDEFRVESATWEPNWTSTMRRIP